MIKKLLKKAVCAAVFSVAVFAAAGACFASDADTQRAESLIFALTGTDSGKYDPEKDITRIEFTTELIKALNVENHAEISGEFSDAPSLQPVYDALALGIISKGSSFRPSDPITFNEAVKMTVSAIGCDIVAQRNGGYPNGYIKAASEKHLLKGMSKTYGNISLGDMYILLYNMLLTEDYYPNEIKGDKVYYTESSDPFIYRLYGVRSVKGIITKTHANSYNADYKANNEKTIAVNGNIYASKNDWDELFGMKCSVYYYADSSDRDVLTVIPEENNIETVLLSDDISLDGENLKVKDSTDKSRNYTLKKGYISVYNGRTENISVSSAFGKDGFIRMVDNNNDSVYDVVFINKADYVIVKNADIANRVISDINSSENDVSFDELKTKCKIKSRSNEKINPVDIKPDSVLEVYKSSDGSVINITVLDEEIKGKITSFDSEEQKYEIDGGTHMLTEYADKYFSDKAALGKSGVYVLDTRGSIVYVKTEDSRFGYGFVLKAAEERNIKKDILIKLFTEGGAVLTFKTADKITLDGVSKTPARNILGINIENCLIRYRTDQDGIINGIDTCETFTVADLDNAHFETPKSEDNSLSRYIYSANSFVYKSSGTAGEYFNINGSKVMMIPSDLSKEEEFSVRPYSQLPSGKSYSMEVYDVDEYGNAGIVIIRGETESLNETMNAYMIASVRNSSNDGDWGLSLELWRNGSFDTFFLPTDVEYSMAEGSSLKPGCIVRVSSEEKIIKKLIVDFDITTLNGNRSYDSRSASLNGGNQNLTYQTGVVYRANNSFVMLSNMRTGKEYDFSPVNLKNYSLGSGKIARYNDRTKTVETITVNEISSYKQSGNDADYVVIKQDSYNTNGVFVYKF